MDSVKAKCPHCRRSLKLDVRDAGLTVICPACGQRFAVPTVLRTPPLPSPPGVPPILRPAEPPLSPAPQIGPTAEDADGDTLFTPGVVIALAVAAGILIGVLGVSAILWLNRAPAAAVPARPASPFQIPPPLAPPIVPHPSATPPASRPVPATRGAPASDAAAALRLPATAPAATQSSAQPVHHGLTPVRPAGPRSSGDAGLDERIGRAIDRGTDYLIRQFRHGVLPAASDGEGEPAGRDALAVYATLQAARATARPDLAVDSHLTGEMLSGLDAMPMRSTDTTYDRSLRASALGIYNRPADRRTLEGDALWLERAGRGGGYTYDPPARRPSAAMAAEEEGEWDNSNSQYGALGVWAAEDAGVAVSSEYWVNVRRHWVRSQRINGQWGYVNFTSPSNDGRLSMTVAGITMMLVAEDHLGVGSAVEEVGRPPYSPTVSRALAWLGAGDHAVDLPEDWPAYTLYGLERAGLASGLKSFGRHDWYRELAAKQVLGQGPDGSWGGVVDTAFTLLFLARGRHPILFDKLQFDGAWANRPRDVANLTRFASTSLERQLNWQVVSVHDSWQNWTDAPVLFLASHATPLLADEDVDKLRAYAEAGGLIFTSTDAESPAFDRFVTGLAARLFPRYPLHDLPADDPVYRSLFPLDKSRPRSPLRGVSNGSRLLLLHSPADLGRTWQLHEFLAEPGAFRLGLNVFIYAAGKADFLNRLQSAYVAEPAVDPVGTTSVARVVYDGDWDPEPAAAGRFARVFLGDTSIRVNVADVDAARLDARATPLAMLTGTGPVRLSAAQELALHRYVAAGGVLLVDACGGSATFANDARGTVLPHAFGTVPLLDLSPDHPILTGAGPGMTPVDLRLRPFAADRAGVRSVPVQSLAIGQGLVLFCPVDVTTGLLGTNTWGVDGYEPGVAYGLARNALLWAVERPDR